MTTERLSAEARVQQILRGHARGACRATAGDEDVLAEYFGGRLEGIF